MVNWSLTRVQRTHSGKGMVSTINGIGNTGYPHAKKNQIFPLPYTTQKINSKWIKDLNV